MLTTDCKSDYVEIQKGLHEAVCRKRPEL